MIKLIFIIATFVRKRYILMSLSTKISSHTQYKFILCYPGIVDWQPATSHNMDYINFIPSIAKWVTENNVLHILYIHIYLKYHDDYN